MTQEKKWGPFDKKGRFRGLCGVLGFGFGLRGDEGGVDGGEISHVVVALEVDGADLDLLALAGGRGRDGEAAVAVEQDAGGQPRGVAFALVLEAYAAHAALAEFRLQLILRHRRELDVRGDVRLDIFGLLGQLYAEQNAVGFGVVRRAFYLAGDLANALLDAGRDLRRGGRRKLPNDRGGCVRVLRPRDRIEIPRQLLRLGVCGMPCRDPILDPSVVRRHSGKRRRRDAVLRRHRARQVLF